MLIKYLALICAMINGSNPLEDFMSLLLARSLGEMMNVLLNSGGSLIMLVLVY